jgi:outer membrane immunogenic protein
MKTAALFATAAFAMIASTSAGAQDTTDSPTFTGPRIEGQFGYEFVGASPRNIQDFQGRDQFGDDSIDENVLFGVEGGYDQQVGNVVVGGYAGVDYGDARVQSINAPYQFSVSRQLTAGLRVGVPVRGVLLYAKGGYSNGRLKETVQTGGNAALFADYDRNRNGYHIGAGFDVPVNSSLYTRFDYSYHEFEKFRIGSTQELEFNRHRVVAALGLRF